MVYKYFISFTSAYLLIMNTDVLYLDKSVLKAAKTVLDTLTPRIPVRYLPEIFIKRALGPPIKVVSIFDVTL